MLRLTNSIEYCEMHCDFGKGGECFFEDESKCYERNIYDKLRGYELMEEQGLLLRLPCKAKQIVYIIDPNLCRRKNKPFKCEVDEFIVEEFSCFAVLNACECHNAMRRFKAVHINCFGITVFLTREEAEAALEKLKGEEDE